MEYNSFPLQTLAQSHFGHYVLNHTIHSFRTSFFRVSVQNGSLVQAKEAQMGGYSCSSSDRLQKPAGTLPPALSIHLVSWCNSTFLRVLLSVSQDFGQNVTIWTGLINGMKNEIPNYTHRSHDFFLKWLTILIKKNIIMVVSFKPSEIVYSDSLQQGEWVKLLNRIHSDWLNWSQAKTDLQDLRDSGHWANKRKMASTENVQTTVLMGNNKLASPKASTEIYNNKISRPKASQLPLFKTWDHWSETPAYYTRKIHFKILIRNRLNFLHWIYIIYQLSYLLSINDLRCSLI